MTRSLTQRTLARLLPGRPTLSMIAMALVILMSRPPLHADARMADDTQDLDSRTRARLATVFARFANEILQSASLNVQGMRVSLDFLQNAARLDPNSPATWRKIIILANAMDLEDLLGHATIQLLAQAPKDELAQLDRLHTALDQFNTADERIEAMEQMLSEENIRMLGPTVSARIAFRLADLHRRRGDIDTFGRWLSESVALDPTYSDAVGVATGFSKDRVTDRVAYVRMLVGLLMADFTDDTILETIDLFLLDAGAYEAAARLLQLRINQMMANGTPPGSSLYSQLALAQWGLGDRAAALATLAERKRVLNNLFETLAAAEDTKKTPLELARLQAPLPPMMASLQAILTSDAEASVRNEAIEELLISADFQEGISNLAESQSAGRAARLMHAYWLLVWLDADEALLETRLTELQAIEDLSEDAIKRIDAWKKLRAGDAAGAEAMFQDDHHTLGQAGLVEALQAQGRQRDAAQALLIMWNGGKNRIGGLWARDKLQDLLGTKIPPSEEAIEMNALVAMLPKLLDRVAKDPRLAVSLRLTASTDSFGPYDPILVDIEVSNNTPLPMGIERGGPIKNLILLLATVEVPYAETPPGGGIVVEIPGRLRLMPFESIHFTVDLRRYWVGETVDRHPLYGTGIDIRALLNFRMETGLTTGQPSHVPGLLGVETNLDEIRVDGQRVTEAWVSRVIEECKGERFSSEDMVDMALLSHVVDHNQVSLTTSTISDELIAEAISGIIDAYPRLDEVSQAWLISVLSQSPRLDAIRDMASYSTDPLPHLMQLMQVLRQAQRGSDVESLLQNATLTAALNSDTDSVRMLAEWIEGMAQTVRDNRINLLTKDSEPGTKGE